MADLLVVSDVLQGDLRKGYIKMIKSFLMSPGDLWKALVVSIAVLG